MKPLTNGVEILIQPSETGGLPLTEYILKYNSADKPNDQSETLVIPGEIIVTFQISFERLNNKLFFRLAQTPSDDQQQLQTLKIEKIKPSTSYRLIIVAKSRAGTGQQTDPISFRTLDRQIPDFKIAKTDEMKNETCSNDRSCLIKWTIESDGGAPIIRSEILYAKVKNSI